MNGEGHLPGSSPFKIVYYQLRLGVIASRFFRAWGLQDVGHAVGATGRRGFRLPSNLPSKICDIRRRLHLYLAGACAPDE